jgi:hydroxylamine reductase (hybrid-cluster protein)
LISYITTPIILVAAVLTGLLNLSVGPVATFCFTIGVVCFLIGMMEVKAWQRVRKDVLALDGLTQLLTGVLGVVSGMIALL